MAGRVMSRGWCCGVLLALAVLGGCSSRPTAFDVHGARGQLRPGGNYAIRPGDTLFGIAWRYGLDMNELARWNNITDPNRILAGSILRTSPPSGVMRERVVVPQVSQAGQPGWMWPSRGNVVRRFNASQPGHQGIQISGQRGQPVFAARDGEVAYNGSGLSGVGRMVILRHDDKVLSAYGYLADTLVSEKQRVTRGQQIATMGISPQNVPALHFETRKQGQPVNPFIYIGTTPRH